MKRRPLNSGFVGRQSAQEEKGSISDAVLKQGRKSGQLNLSNRGLTEVPEKVWRINLDVPEEAKSVSLDCEDRWWDQVDLTKLILASNSLTEISGDVFNLPALVLLDIHDNSLTTLPEEIGSLSCLQKLNLGHNKISSLPMSMAQLESLCSLKLEHNSFKSLECWLGSLRNLEELDVSYNMVSSLPSLAGLKHLRTLNLSNNALETLPPEFDHLQALDDLNISSNKICNFPELKNMKSLRRLDCRQNHLTSVPSVGQCPSLKELYLAYNKIAELDSKVFAGYSGLTVLDLHDNLLTSIPEDIIILRDLERLDLTNNDISGLPYKIGNMSNLKSLVLNGNPLRELRRDIVMRGTQAIMKHLKSRIPDDDGATDQPDASVAPLPSVSMGSSGAVVDMHTLGHTKTLNYSGKKSASIPVEVLEAAVTSEVKTVDFSKNMLTDLPERITALSSSVSDLNLGFNKITSLPSGICSFTQLEFLDLRNNQLSSLPDGFASLRSLREIIISYNRFSCLPPVLYSMISLRTLLACDNQIAVIDVDGLLRMSVLETLDLQNNNISQVPPELGNVRGLKALQLGGNPFRTPRAAILAKGTQALLEYLRDRIPR
ncbi:leucine-rich repeat-containing protein 40 isoform X1 [Nematostella vectensis]|uniref:leucine-rich repeat-containing protein 40 isoform X1 n=1 Tax=Nematostella vectensis TaxID=45351 RepID=UPI002076DA30|nr:leucine-rich repeat-containing protein 40 isoform X1 [Nematostella vectensis]